MITETIGGMDLKKIDALEHNRLLLLGCDPYEYYLSSVRGKASLKIDWLNDFSVYIHNPSQDFALKINHQTIHSEASAFLISGADLEIEILSGAATLLIAGLNDSSLVGRSSLEEFTEDQIKKVVKPWGYELWITGESHKNFAFKKIFIKATTKTSLQYHEYKRETNLLFSGKANLHFNPDAKVPAMRFAPENTAHTLLNPICVVDVFPNKIHRLEAISDILLFEVSTPHLNDVIRISDDSGRSNGKVTSEHV